MADRIFTSLGDLKAFVAPSAHDRMVEWGEVELLQDALREAAALEAAIVALCPGVRRDFVWEEEDGCQPSILIRLADSAGPEAEPTPRRHFRVTLGHGVAYSESPEPPPVA